MVLRIPRWIKFGAFFLLGASLIGCGRTFEDTQRAIEGSTPELNPSVGGGGAKKREPIAAGPRTGTLTGKVTFTGDKSKIAKVQLVPAGNAECMHAKDLKGSENDVYDQNWFVSEGEGVKNVVVFLVAPDGKFIPFTNEDKKEAKDAARETAQEAAHAATLDQPFCAFHPQVTLLTPYVLDADGTKVKTGKNLKILNSGNILHNANLQNADPRFNVGFNEAVPPRSKIEKALNPQPSPLNVRCSVHPWMSAYIWVFEHPYAAKTDENGQFTIPNVPTDVDLQIVFWHGARGFFSDGGEKGSSIRLAPKETKQVDRTISP